MTTKKNLEYGEILEIQGNFSEPSEARNYKGFNYKEYLKTLKIYGTIRVELVKKEEKKENTNSNKVEENQSKNKTNTVGYSKYYGTWENESNSSGLEIKSIENNVIVFTWFIYRIASIDDVALPIENNKAVFYYSGVDDSNYNNVIEDNEHYYRKAILELKDNEVTVTVKEVTAEEYNNNLNLEKEFSGGLYITEGEYVYNKK